MFDSFEARTHTQHTHTHSLHTAHSTLFERAHLFVNALNHYIPRNKWCEGSPTYRLFATQSNRLYMWHFPWFMRPWFTQYARIEKGYISLVTRAMPTKNCVHIYHSIRFSSLMVHRQKSVEIRFGWLLCMPVFDTHTKHWLRHPCDIWVRFSVDGNNGSEAKMTVDNMDFLSSDPSIVEKIAATVSMSNMIHAYK